jgi:cell division septation protein DedD
MDWLRRNWPDMAIGLALVAVIAGIVATLITGGSFFPVAPATPSIPPTVIAPLPGPAAAIDSAQVDVPPTSPGAVSVLTPDGEVVEPTTPSAAIPPTTPAATPATPAVESPPAATAPGAAPTVTVLAPVSDASPTPATPPAAATPAAATPVPAQPAAAAPAPAAGLPVASSNEAAPYRVSVGAFGSPDNAARQAQTFRAAGYPVFTGTQGALTIVLVGPYDTEAEANRVAAQITAGGFGVAPVVYRFRPDAATPGASTPTPGALAAAPAPASTPLVATPAADPAPAAVAVPVAAAPAAATPAVPAAAPAAIQTASSGRSLQVGAFADATSAAPLRERLASLGLVAFEVREDGLIKLLVGPFEAARLTEVRRQLAAVGIESFPR